MWNGRVGFSFLVYSISKNALGLENARHGEVLGPVCRQKQMAPPTNS
jgi:hypothetical protein